MENQRDFKVINGFILKIIAIVFMTIDHIGFFLGGYENTADFVYIFRILGRFSFPIIIFLLVEGIRHTKSIAKYFTRLGILAFAFMFGQLIFYFFISPEASDVLSPALDLILTASIVYLLKRKDKYSFLAIIPFAWAILSLVVRSYELTHFEEITWFPFIFRLDYSIYGPLLGVAFFYAKDLTSLFLKSNEGTKDFVGTTYEQTTYNLICAIMLIVLTTILTIIDRYAFSIFVGMPWQIYALFAALPIIFYSGKRGYNAKWFQYGCYIYFPAHLIILFLIFALI